MLFWIRLLSLSIADFDGCLCGQVLRSLTEERREPRQYTGAGSGRQETTVLSSGRGKACLGVWRRGYA